MPGHAGELETGFIKTLAKTNERVRLLDDAIGKFNSSLHDIESRYNPEIIEDLLQQTSAAINEACEACSSVDKDFREDPDVLRNLRNDFRLRTNAIISKSHYMNHSRIWPKGYPGDYKIIEAMYRNIPVSAGLGRLLDMLTLNTTLAIAVRHRLSAMAGFLREELLNRTSPRVLNIACGSCRELFSLAPEIIGSNATFLCIDHDEDALNFAASRLLDASLAGHIEMRKYNALRIVNHERNLQEFGPQDIIYSIGFFDYLADGLLIRIFSSLYKLLNPGGTFIAAFKDSRRYKTPEYHWMVDWAGFYQRTEEDSATIIEKAGIPLEKCSRTRDASGVIIFYRAKKD
ncbi:MAG: class I SAM-dependent methyltransferase [Actinomycetota bacterium]|nr:class I SAM-dependent methyltransferase [Actinomycetota bacterium]